MSSPSMMQRASAMRVRRGRRIEWGQLFSHATLVFILFFTFFPFLFEIKVSFQDLHDFQHSFWLPTWPLRFSNYAAAWHELSRYILNSLYVTVVSVVGLVVIAVISAYVFARHEFPGSQLIFYLVLGLIMLPSALMFIPRFILVRDLGLFNTLSALILPYIALGQPFSIMVLRSFFETLPQEIFEAGRIDGATELQILLSIVAPMARAPIVLVGIVQSLNIYNDYLWPLIMISDEKLKTAAIAIIRFTTGYVTQYGALMAGYTLISIPLIILFAFGMRYFVEGIASGGVKF